MQRRDIEEWMGKWLTLGSRLMEGDRNVSGEILKMKNMEVEQYCPVTK